MRRLVVVVVLIALLGACGGDDGDQADKSETTAEVTTATQAASIVAPFKADLDKAIADEDACTDISCMFAAARIERGRSMNRIVFGLQSSLRAAAPYDDEVEELATATGNQGHELTEQWANEVETCLAHNTQMDACEPVLGEASQGVRDLASQLKGWDPYL